MSTAPAPLRRADKQMTEAEVRSFIGSAFCLRIGTVGGDGYPYVLPLLFVVLDDAIVVHTTAAEGHFRSNAVDGAKVCLEWDEPGEVFGYGRTECDTSLSYRSAIAFGTMHEVQDRAYKQRFCSELMSKYARHIEGREKDMFPRLDHIRVYTIGIERLTGKQTIRKPAVPS